MWNRTLKQKRGQVTPVRMLGLRVSHVVYMLVMIALLLYSAIFHTRVAHAQMNVPMPVSPDCVSGTHWGWIVPGTGAAVTGLAAGGNPGCVKDAPPPPPPPPAGGGAPSQPPSVTTADQQQACVNYGLVNGFYKSSTAQQLWQYGGPAAGTGESAYSAPTFPWLNPQGGYDYVFVGTGSFDPPDVPTTMVWFNDGVVNICFYTPGTIQLIGFLNVVAGVNGGGGG